MNAPRVSVLLAVRNGGPYFAPALRSVLGQGLKDLELVVVDDGSTDNSAAVASSLGDPRVRVLDNQGRGLGAALNLGLSDCQGTYIARMDADDLCRQGRLEAQVAFLEGHPGVGVLGGQIRRFGVPGLRQYHLPTSHAAIQAAAVFDSPLAQPAPMFRASLLPKDAETYDPTEPPAEDYGLWTRWLMQGVLFAALPEVLLDYRVHPGQVSTERRQTLLRVADGLRLRWLQRMGLDPTHGELELHRGAARGEWGLGLDALAALEAWLMKLRSAARASAFLDAEAFDSLLAERWTSALWANRGLGRPARRLARASALSGLRHPNLWKPWAAWLGTFAPRGR